MRKLLDRFRRTPEVSDNAEQARAEDFRESIYKIEQMIIDSPRGTEWLHCEGTVTSKNGKRRQAKVDVRRRGFLVCYADDSRNKSYSFEVFSSMVEINDSHPDYVIDSINEVMRDPEKVSYFTGNWSLIESSS